MPRFLVWLPVWVSAASAALQPTATTLSVTGTTVYGSSITVHAQVNASQGSMAIAVDKQAPQSFTLDGSGGANLTLSPAAGSHTVDATYSGTSGFAGSTATMALTIAKAATIVGLTASPAAIGQAITLNATVAVPNFPTMLGGTLAFGGAPGCGTVPLANGIATCVTKFATAGSFDVTATFSGDNNTLGSTGDLALTVARAVPAVYTATAPNSPVFGVASTLSALVQGISTLGAPTGSVTFSAGGKALGTQALDGEGRATLSAQWNAGVYPVSATYSGDSNYLPSPAVPFTLTVGKASTVLAVSSDAPQVGQPATLRATVLLAAGTGAISGTVDFTASGTPVAGCTGLALTAGAAACQSTFGQLGPLILGGTYSGDANTLATTAQAAVTVGKAAPGLYLTQSPASPVYGQTVTVSSLLMGAAGLAAPGGTITFTSGSSILGTPAVGADGRASATANWGAGVYTVTAVYSGDANYQAPPTATLTVTVGKAPTTLVVSADPAQVGQRTMLRASVTLASGTGTIGGTVDFSAGGKAVAGCTGVAVTAGAAACAATFTALGSYALSGTFNGDANTLGSTATATAGVSKAVPGIYLAQSPDAPVFGQALTLDCLLLAATALPTPTGAVTFMDGGRPMGSPMVGSDGHATFAAALAPGLHAITALYSGDTNYQSLVSQPMGTTVTQAATTTTLTAVTGGPFTAVVAPVAPGAGSPTGTVQFRGGGAVLATEAVTLHGAAYAAVLAASAYSGSVTAYYSGDANFAASNSAAAAVSAVASTVRVSSDRNPGVAGQAVNLTVTVSATPQGAGAPTGTVAVAADGAALGSAALANGQASFSTVFAAGQHTITAQYGGDANYPAATGSLTLAVQAAGAALTLASSAATAVYGQPVTFTATLGSGEGTVQFSEGGTALGSAVLAAGAASLTLTLPVGIHTVTASWAGDGSTAASTAQVVETVNKAATSLALATTAGALVATASAVAPGAGTPTGTVRFLDADSNAVLATVALSGAMAGAALPATTDAAVAQYAGDGNFAPAVSPALRLLTVTNAASYAAGGVAADELVTLFAPALAGATAAKIVDSMGAALSGQMIFVSPAQATILLPANVAAGAATLTITTPARMYSAPVTIGGAAPGLFTADGSGQGAPAAQVIATRADGTASDAAPATRPIDVSGGAVYVVLYGTGIRHAVGAPVCTVGGIAAQVLYAGPQGGTGGLDQVNVLLPDGLQGAGQVPLLLTVDGAQANPVVLTIR